MCQIILSSVLRPPIVEWQRDVNDSRGSVEVDLEAESIAPEFSESIGFCRDPLVPCWRRACDHKRAALPYWSSFFFNFVSDHGRSHWDINYGIFLQK